MERGDRVRHVPTGRAGTIHRVLTDIDIVRVDMDDGRLEVDCRPEDLEPEYKYRRKRRGRD